jgi:hypothetical protein
MDRRSRTGKMVYLIHFHKERMDDIMTFHFEVRIHEEMAYVILATRKKVINTNYISLFFQEIITEVAAEKARASCN